MWASMMTSSIAPATSSDDVAAAPSAVLPRDQVFGSALEQRRLSSRESMLVRERLDAAVAHRTIAVVAVSRLAGEGAGTGFDVGFGHDVLSIPEKEGKKNSPRIAPEEHHEARSSHEPNAQTIGAESARRRAFLSNQLCFRNGAHSRNARSAERTKGTTGRSGHSGVSRNPATSTE